MSRRTSRALVAIAILTALPVAASPAGDSLHTWSRAELRAELLSGDFSVQPAQRPARSIPLAFVLSAAVPGAGQAYNGQWIKAAAALSLEAAALTVWSSFRRRGLSGEDDFKAFAHADWDPGQYASWLNDYASWLGDVNFSAVTIPSGINFGDPNGWSSAQRSAVFRMFDEIRAIEREVYHPETGASFSHQLPYFGEQQYYELIGKYFQFAPGWSDYAAWRAEDGSFTDAIDPERTGPGGSKPNVSTTFRRYAADHADAQDLLRAASRMSTVFVLNHLIAAVDAAVSAKLHSDRVSARMALTADASGRPVPVTQLTLRF